MGRADRRRGLFTNAGDASPMAAAPRIGYGLREKGMDLQNQTWELRGRGPLSAIGFLSRRLGESLVEGLRMQLDQDRLAISGRSIGYYTPLDALRPGRYGAAFPRRMATLAWRCLAERCVELPVARAFLAERRWNSLLEIGNVLGYWYDLPAHTVVDRYERGTGIQNQDIVEFHPTDRYDAIVSISTLEHVGFDEPVPDPAKFLRAVRVLEGLRSPGGRIFLSVPIGYNPAVDRAVREGEFSAYRTNAIVGDPSGRRGWHEVPIATALERRDGILFATLE